MFASSESLKHAESVYSALYRWGAADRTDYESDEEIEFNTRLDGYLTAVRADIGILGVAADNGKIVR